jgi:hypothetical protein
MQVEGAMQLEPLISNSEDCWIRRSTVHQSEQVWGCNETLMEVTMN